MAERIVKWRSIIVNGQTVMRGTEVDLSKLDEEKYDALGALEALPGQPEKAPAEPTTFEGMTADEIAGLIKERKLTIPKVVAMVAGDPELARLALEAEDTATGGSPRSTLVESLGVVIAEGNAHGDTSDDEDENE